MRSGPRCARILVEVVLLVALLNAFVAKCWATPDLRGELYKEGPKGWARIRDAEAQITGTLRTEVKSVQNGKVVQERIQRNIFRQNGSFYSFTSGGPGPNTVIACGPSYTFKLYRARETGPFTLTGLHFGDPVQSSNSVRNSAFFWNVLGSSRMAWGVPLEELIADPGFVFKRIAKSSDEDRDIIRLDFACDSKRFQKQFSNAWIVFSPAENWAIQASEYNLSADWRVIIKNEYHPDKSGVHRLYRSENTYTSASQPKNIQHYDYTFDEIESEVIPASTFTLSGYGFPEPRPPVAAERASHLHYWYLGAGAVLYVLAFALRRRTREAIQPA